MPEIQKHFPTSYTPVIQPGDAGKDTQSIRAEDTKVSVANAANRDELIEKAWKLKSSSIGRMSSKPNNVYVDGFNIGELIDGKYRIGEFIGSGGLGVIYSATDNDGNKVAIKALKGGEIPEINMQRFLREASVMALLEHQNIVSLVDVGVDRDRPYIAMEYVGNGTFMDVIRFYHNGYIDLSTALHYVADLCLALEKMHEDGRFVHRDLSPANILLSTETTNLMDRKVDRNIIKLADFGLTHVSDASKMLTDFGQIMGTVRFSPVIDMIGGKVDSRSDLYSVGALLYYLTMKKLPFDDPEGGDSKKGAINIVDQHLYKKPDFSEADSRLPSTLMWLIQKLLEKDPDNRPQKASEVESMLREVAVSAASSSSLIVAPMFNPAAEIFPEPIDRKKESGSAIKSTVIDAAYHGITPNLLTKVAEGEEFVVDFSFDAPPASSSLARVLVVDGDIAGQALIDAYVNLWSNENSCDVEVVKCGSVKEALDAVVSGIVDNRTFDLVISNNKVPLLYTDSSHNSDQKLSEGEVLYKVLGSIAPKMPLLLYDDSDGKIQDLDGKQAHIIGINDLDSLPKRLNAYHTYFQSGHTTQMKIPA